MRTKICNLLMQFTRKYSRKINDEVLVYKHLNGAQQGISLLGLNRPQQRNALSSELVHKLIETVDRIAYEDTARVLIVHSLVPKTFCAGADLKDRLAMKQEEIPGFVKKLRGLVYKIFNLPMPVIAALDGVALGGGLEIALGADIRVAADNVKLGLVETKLAVMPGAGGTQFLPRLINRSIAKELIFTSSILNGREAERLGIINHLVEQNDNYDAALLKSIEIAEKILPNGPVGIKMAKQAINKGLEVDLNSGLEIEEVCYAKIVPTKDRVEGLEAFVQKRPPVYVGS